MSAAQVTDEQLLARDVDNREQVSPPTTAQQATRVLRVRGSIDDSTVHAFHHELLATIAVGGSVLVDLTQADLFPTVAVTALLSGMTHAAAVGCSMHVTAAPGGVPHRVLTICGIAHRTVATAPVAGTDQSPPVPKKPACAEVTQ